MDKSEILSRIKECKEEIEAIDHENGELTAQIQEVQKQLELARSRVATWETKVIEGNSWQIYATATVILLFSFWYLFR